MCDGKALTDVLSPVHVQSIVDSHFESVVDDHRLSPTENAIRSNAFYLSLSLVTAGTLATFGSFSKPMHRSTM